jgi:hypothetical protein
LEIDRVSATCSNQAGFRKLSDLVVESAPAVVQQFPVGVRARAIWRMAACDPRDQDLVRGGRVKEKAVGQLAQAREAAECNYQAVLGKVEGEFNDQFVLDRIVAGFHPIDFGRYAPAKMVAEVGPGDRMNFLVLVVTDRGGPAMGTGRVGPAIVGQTTDRLSAAAAIIDLGVRRDQAVTSGRSGMAATLVPGGQTGRVATIGRIGMAIMATGVGTATITTTTGTTTGTIAGMITTSTIITMTGITAPGATIGRRIPTRPRTLGSTSGGSAR